MTKQPYAFDILGDEYMKYVIGKKWKGNQFGVRKIRSWKEACRISQMTFSLTKKQLVHPDGTGRFIPAWGIFRDDNRELVSTVGQRYELVPFDQTFLFVDPLVQEAKGAYYAGAGALGNGNKFWALVRIPEADIRIHGTGDINRGHLLFLSSHDGTLATTCRLTEHRDSCNNVLVTQLTRASGELLKIKHTQKAGERLELTTRAIGDILKDVSIVENKLNTLAMRSITLKSFVSIMNKLFPSGVSTRRANVLLGLTEAFEDNEGNKFPELKGTAYSLLNVITDFADHHRDIRLTQRREGFTEAMARAESAIFGSGGALKLRALDVILAETKDNPLSPRRTPFSPGRAVSDTLFSEIRSAVDIVTKKPLITKTAS